MPRVLAIVNQKGGVAKTTTAAALGVTLSRAGYATHLVDADPQASLTHVFGQHETEGLLYQALAERRPLPVVRLTDNLTLTPSSIDLAKAESQFLGEPAREYLLRTSLEAANLPGEPIVILDAPPSLGVVSINCLAAAQYVIIPLHPGNLEVDVLPTLNQAIATARKHLNPSLEILGTVLTKVDRREKLASVIHRHIRRAYPLLGTVRSETKLKYAMGDGRLLELSRSKALAEYERIGRRVAKQLWHSQRTNLPA